MDIDRFEEFLNKSRNYLSSFQSMNDIVKKKVQFDKKK